MFYRSIFFTCVTPHFVQTPMLSRALEGDVLRDFDEIQKWVDDQEAGEWGHH